MGGEGGSIGTSEEVYAKLICMRMVAAKEEGEGEGNETNGRKRRRRGINTKRKKKEIGGGGGGGIKRGSRGEKKSESANK